MFIKSITVSSTRKLPHPAADFASVSAYASLTAELGPEDQALISTYVGDLQARADVAVEKHMDTIIAGFRQRRVDTGRAAAATEATGDALADKYRAK